VTTTRDDQRRQLIVPPAIVALFGLECVNDAIANAGWGPQECCVCRKEIAEQDPAYLLLYRNRTPYFSGELGELFHHVACQPGAALTLRMIGADEAATSTPLVEARCGAGGRCTKKIGWVSYYSGSYWWVGIEGGSFKSDDGRGGLRGRRKRRHEVEKDVAWDHDQRTSVGFGYPGNAQELNRGVEVSGWCEQHQRERHPAVDELTREAAMAKQDGRVRVVVARR
jgi:hypothetical protein